MIERAGRNSAPAYFGLRGSAVAGLDALAGRGTIGSMRSFALRLLAAAATVIAMLGTAAAVPADSPPSDGLVLWLDASDAATLAVADGSVVAWRDKSASARSCQSRGAGRATFVADAMNGRGVVRFDGRVAFDTDLADVARTVPGPVNVFVVSRRVADQAGGPKWQRVVSNWNGSGHDNAAPNSNVLAGRDGNSDAYGPVIDHATKSDATLAKLRIGGNAQFDGQFLRGDVAEVLVYDREFLTFDDAQAVYRYLAAKWAAALPPALGWTRREPLEETPQRVTDTLPLSDQANRAGWVRHEPLTDEFDGDTLDRRKWTDSMAWWKGRPPAWFSPNNVAVRDGMLQLTFRRDEPPPDLVDQGYRDYSSACAMSIHGNTLRYGYVEIRARPMASAASSSFWLYVAPGTVVDPPGGSLGREIDVFEIGGKSVGRERSYCMNLHAERIVDGQKQTWTSGGTWTAPFEFAADFHVYGLRWEEDEIEYFVDGVPVRRVNNDCWHLPMHVIIDSESMIDWLGSPDDADLPSTYSIDYVRTWVRKKP